MGDLRRLEADSRFRSQNAASRGRCPGGPGRRGAVGGPRMPRGSRSQSCLASLVSNPERQGGHGQPAAVATHMHSHVHATMLRPQVTLS